MSISPPRTKLIVSHCWLLKHSRVKMSASRFLVHNKVHFLLRVNDLFLVNFVHIWGRRGVTPPQTLCSQDASLFAPPLSRFNERNADDDVDSPDSQRRMSEIGVKEGRESASFDWLLGPVGGLRGWHILTHFICIKSKLQSQVQELLLCVTNWMLNTFRVEGHCKYFNQKTSHPNGVCASKCQCLYKWGELLRDPG